MCLFVKNRANFFSKKGCPFDQPHKEMTGWESASLYKAKIKLKSQNELCNLFLNLKTNFFPTHPP